ncbi:MAG: hypothetical protein JW910_04670 [Anaerolineae bacterium]|nr:hypothetical protein [Anaerolineae bacterium]
MSQELEALVSHLYVVGGRAVRVPPSGALVQLAPRRAPAHRARDAFFALVLPTPGHHAQADFYERMARLAAERYFASEGDVRTGLQTTLASINHDLWTHNQAYPRKPFYADIVCLVLRGEDIYVARAGGGLLLLWQEGGFEVFPLDMQPGPPLGNAADAVLKVAHYPVAPGQLVALSGPELATVPGPQLHQVGAAGDVQAAVNKLKTNPLQTAAVLVMQFISPDAPDPALAAPPAAPAQAAPAPPAPAEPAHPAAEASAQADPSAEAAALAEKKARGPGLRARVGNLARQGRARGQAVAEAVPRPSLEAVQDESRNFLLRLGNRLLMFLRRVLLRLAGGLGGLRRLLDRMLPEPEPGQSPSVPTSVAASVAMLLPVAVVVLVVALALTTRDETSFEQCLSQVQIAAQVARQIDANGSGDPQEAWYGVMESVTRCTPLRPDDPALAVLREEAQGHLDRYAQVVRCPMLPLRRFDPGADLRGPLLQGSVNLYTLDVARSALYRDMLNESGDALIRESELIVSRGAAIGDQVIRNLVDIAWVDEGGIPSRTGLVALDNRGALVGYSPVFPPATAQAFVGADRMIGPTRIETWRGRLYILDPPANQIWRFQPSGGSYPSAPEEYFVGDQRPELGHAVDIAIDETGYLYVLFEDGSMRKYLSGEEQFFQFSGLPSGALTGFGSANALFLDTGRISPGFYVLDAANQVFHETSTGGTFISSYRAPYGTSFRELSGLTVDDSAENLYVVARDTLYHIPKCE